MLRRGDRVKLANGWKATIEDNKRGNTRMATVEGFVTEMGSVYAHDIVEVKMPSGVWVPIVHTPAQLALRGRVKALDAMIGVGGA
jgi:hypothetical protein